MKNLFYYLLLHSPSLRKLMSFIYKHSSTSMLFHTIRAVNVDKSFAAADAPPSISEESPLWTEETGWGKRISIASYVHIIRGNKNFAGQRVAVLAHWNTQGIIAPYVLYYAAHLKSLGFFVVLASGGPLAAGMTNAPELDAIVFRDCPGYDFTSWKAAFEAFSSLYQARELFLTNDSIFAPVGSFAPIFNAMENVRCDVWGLVECAFHPSYLQSYGLLFRERALRSPALAEFFDRVPLSGERAIALNCEHRLGIWLNRNGLSIGAWLPSQALPWPWFNPLHRTWRQMIEMGLPLFKRDLLTHNPDFYQKKMWRRVLAQHGYPLSLITEYIDGSLSAEAVKLQSSRLTKTKNIT